jgi:hypothetical protein
MNNETTPTPSQAKYNTEKTDSFKQDGFNTVPAINFGDAEQASLEAERRIAELIRRTQTELEN